MQDTACPKCGPLDAARENETQVRCAKHGRFIRRRDDGAVKTIGTLPGSRDSERKLFAKAALDAACRRSRNIPKHWADRRRAKGEAA